MEQDRPDDRSGKEIVARLDPVTDAALNWLFTLQAEGDDAAVQGAFRRWLGAAPEHETTFGRVSEAWDLPEMEMVARAIVAREGQEKVVSLDRARSFRARGWTNIAAGLAAAIVLSLGALNYSAMRVHWLADYQTAAGEQEAVVLPDGSRVTLNTGTALELDFSGARRGVTLLKGEAYFDVTPDPDRPFRVTAGFSQVEVLGTAFSVRTDSDGDFVALNHGHVEVVHKDTMHHRAALEAGESIAVSPKALRPVEKADTEQSFAWLERQIVFENRPFSEAISDIARYHGAPVIIMSSRLKSIRVNGDYKLDNSERVIRSLTSAAGGVVTRLPGGTILIR